MADSKPEPQGVDAAALARLWKCTEQVVFALARQHIAVRIKGQAGRFALADSTTNYIVHLREQAAGRQSKRGDIDPVAENALLKREQRMSVALKRAEAEGRLISLPEVKAAWEAYSLAVKAVFLSLPSRLRFDIPHLTGHDQKVMVATCREMLAEVSRSTMPMPTGSDGAPQTSTR